MPKIAIADRTVPNSDLKANPAKFIIEAGGEPLAVLSGDDIAFYAVPADLFQDMTDFCEYAQRGTSEHKTICSSLPKNSQIDLDDPPRYI